MSTLERSLHYSIVAQMPLQMTIKFAQHLFNVLNKIYKAHIQITDCFEPPKGSAA